MITLTNADISDLKHAAFKQKNRLHENDDHNTGKVEVDAEKLEQLLYAYEQNEKAFDALTEANAHIGDLQDMINNLQTKLERFK